MRFAMRFVVIALLATACRTPGTDVGALVKGLEGCGGSAVDPTFVQPTVLANLMTPADPKATAASDRVATKTPALIYLAVDTDEPFMKLSVDHELRALRTACALGAKVNWLALVNSHLVRKVNGVAAPIFMRCVEGQYKEGPLPEPAAQLLALKREIYGAGKKCSDGPNPTCLRIVQPSGQQKEKEFKDFPLAHPDVLLDLLEMARGVFPPETYAYALHLKSHGSEDFMTTGLGPEQVAEKSQCQGEVMKKLYETKPELFTPAQGTPASLGQVGLGQVGLGQVGLGQVGLGQVGLGQVGLGQVGLGQVGLGQVGLGQVGLGQVGLGQGTAGLGKVGGLGLGVAGLGATNHYGSRHMTALLALRFFTTKGTGKEDVAFVYFESCESRASRFLQDAAQACTLPPTQNPFTTAFNTVERMHAYYSAAQSLWYRNLDWDLIFKQWKGGEASVRSFQKLLIDTTKLIPNFNFAGQDPLPVCNQ